MKKEDFEKIPTIEEIKKRFGHYVDWYNNKHDHTGQGMDGKTPMQVWRENAVEKREAPADMKPYLFTYRHKRMVRNGGISYGGHWYYNTDKVVEYIGQSVEIRVPLDSDEVVYTCLVRRGISCSMRKSWNIRGISLQIIRKPAGCGKQTGCW
jgi:hypothetical protein